jgi:hypothetical protein
MNRLFRYLLTFKFFVLFAPSFLAFVGNLSVLPAQTSQPVVAGSSLTSGHWGMRDRIVGSNLGFAKIIYHFCQIGLLMLLRFSLIFSFYVVVSLSLSLSSIKAQTALDFTACGTDAWHITDVRNGKFVRGTLQARSTDSRFRWRPAVIRNDRTEPVTYEFRPGSSLTFTSLVILLNSGETFTLRDDGSGGDRARLDSIYTIQIPAALLTKAVSAARPYRPPVGFLRAMNGSTMVAQYNLGVEVWNPTIPTVTIKSLGSAAQASRHLVNLVVPVQALNTIPNDDFRSLAQIFYRYYGDVFDFMNIIHLPSYFGNRYHGNISTTVQGIGIQSLANNSSQYGSAGKLIGFNMYPITSFFDGASDTYVHELGHQWINYLANSALAEGRPHWPLSSIASGGIMGISIGGTGGAGGNFSHRIIQDGSSYRFQAIPPNESKRFRDWELYLMGLLPPDSVSTALVLANQTQTPVNGALVQGAVNQVTIGSIVQQFGVRTPNVNSSQKSFRIATIIVSDSLLSKEEMAFYDFFSSRAGLKTGVYVEEGFSAYTGLPFGPCTGGRGELNSVVDPTLMVTPTTSVYDAASEIFQLRLFPQPSLGVTTLEYTLSQPALVHTDIVNSLGVSIVKYAETQQGSGIHRITIETKALAQGAYFVRVNISGKVATVPLQVVR